MSNLDFFARKIVQPVGPPFRTFAVIVILSGIVLEPIRANYLALLAGTLHTYQAHACDEDQLNIRCPQGTTISIQLAQYGRQVSSLQVCAPKSHHVYKDDTNCSAPLAAKIMMETCQDKRHCKIKVQHSLFGEDPCEGTNKYLELAYKCIPSNFNSHIVCEGEQITLRCRKKNRLAIYSVMYGSTREEIQECPLKEGNVKGDDCQSSFSTETVMRACHGRVHCLISATDEIFGNPCGPNIRKYMSIVYVCVPKRILKPKYVEGEDYRGKYEEEEEEEENGFDKPPVIDKPDPSTYSFDQPYTHPALPSPTQGKNHADGTFAADTGSVSVPPPPPFIHEKKDADEKRKAQDKMPSTISTTTQENCNITEGKGKVIGFISDWMTTYNFIKDNQEKFILYLSLSISLGLVAFLILVIGRLIVQKRQERKKANLNITDLIPNGDMDELTDVEDLTRPGDSSVEVVRYTNRSTMRRQDSNPEPRAVKSLNNRNFYS